MKPNLSNDRRRHQRYFAKKRLFALIRSREHILDRIKHMSCGQIGLAVIKSNPPKMGEVIEISRGGLSFRYIENGSTEVHLNEMDILFVDEDFHLSRIPFMIVKDSEMRTDSPFNVLMMKRLAIQFGGLSQDQEKKLRHVIKNFTTSEVPRLSANSKQVRGGKP